MAAAKFARLDDRIAANDAEFPAARGVPRDGLRWQLAGLWHMLAVVPLSPGRSEAFVSQVGTDHESCALRRHKSCSTMCVRSGDGGFARPQARQHRGGPWHRKVAQKALRKLPLCATFRPLFRRLSTRIKPACAESSVREDRSFAATKKTDAKTLSWNERFPVSCRIA
jgi:hypothetical protein